MSKSTPSYPHRTRQRHNGRWLFKLVSGTQLHQHADTYAGQKSRQMTTTGNEAASTHSTGRTAHYQELVSQLTIAEKVALLTGSDTFIMAGEQKIGLEKVALSDGPTGVRGLKFAGGRQVALLPNATLLASIWSEQTAFEVGTLLAEEAMAQQISVVLGPRSICTDRRSVDVSLRLTPKIRCSPENSPPPTFGDFNRTK